MCMICILYDFHYVSAQEITNYNQLWLEQSKDKNLNQKISSLTTQGNLNAYKNNFLGYSFLYPSDWNIDSHRDLNYVRLYKDNFRVDISLDNNASLNKFMDSTLDTVYNVVNNRKKYSCHNLNIVSFDYSRPAVESIQNDLTEYCYYFVNSNNNIVTIQLKTDKNNFNSLKNSVKDIAESIKFNKPTITDKNNGVILPTSFNDVVLKGDKNNVVLPKDKVVYGAFIPDENKMKDYDQNIAGSHLGSEMIYRYLNMPLSPVVNNIINEKRLPVITLSLKTGDKTTSIIPDILNGKYDSNLNEWVQSIKKTNSPILLRIGNEMNGNWVNWGDAKNYNDPDMYVLTYRYIVNYFKKYNCTNAYFIWNPNIVSAPKYNWNAASIYYPGDKYVDFIGLTAYNFGKTTSGKFNYFDELYNDLYNDYLREYPNKPMMIGEFGSVEKGGDKARFIKETFNLISEKYKNIRLAVWFSKDDGEYDLRIDSSKNSIQAFQEGLKKSSVEAYPLKANPSFIDKPNQSTSNHIGPKIKDYFLLAYNLAPCILLLGTVIVLIFINIKKK